MKKYILLGVLLCALIITPALAQTDNSALIAQLRAQIAALLAQLQALQGGLGTPTPFCWNPNWTNMRIGDRGTGVGTLQEILRQEGFTIAAEERQGVSISDAEFGESTAAAVSGFQEKYADEILRPNGLARGTGYVGPSTRGKLNRLHACKRPIPIPIPVPGAPVINGVSGPTSLGVGVSGEWKVIASGSGVLSYSVIWGDEGLYGSGMGSSGVTRSNTQTATFNHTYNQAGVYKVGFTVTNESGQSTQTSISVRVGDVSTQPAINVTSPNEASIFSQGDILKIRWNNIGTPVRLIQIWLQGPLDGTLTGELSRSVIGANLLNDGDYDWSISNSIVSGKYQIHVRDNSNPDFGGKSGVFIISNATQPTITVLSPNGGESWQKGTAQAITWRDNRQTFAPANWTYNIYLVAYQTPCPPGQPCILGFPPPYTIATGVSGSVYKWSVGKVMNGDGTAPDGAYTVQVCETSTNTCDSSNSYFKIYTSTTDNHPPEIVSGSIPASPIPVNQSVTFGWNAKDADNDDLSWSIDWGDSGGGGGTSNCTQSGRGWTFNTSHAWSQAGTYKVTARVTDCAGASASSVTTVTVGDVVTSGFDLAVSAFELNASGPLATFCNKGTEPLKSFPVWISINSVNQEFDLAGSRAAGACSTHQWDYGTWGFNAMTSDGYYGQVTVDPNNLYAELNEDNNKLQARYPTLVPPPSGGGGGGGSPAVSLSTLSQMATSLQAIRNILNTLR